MKTLIKKIIRYLNITFHQYLTDILTELPANYIIFKLLAGIGASSLEIENPNRNSILLEPNIPVIEGKCKKYNYRKSIKVLGVYEKITEEQIINYLESDVTPKKFLVTPESYQRLKVAIENYSDANIFKDYFLLFDECERTIQDIGYRKDIILPMTDFFKFEKKAFISATPIWPSDPRFLKYGFKSLYIKPTFDHRQDIKLLSTNNVQFTFNKFVEANPRENYFIFLNSTDTIAKLITSQGIQNESAIFCAKDSMQKLKVNNYQHVQTKLAPFKKYNFFTSRFFSAVDIDYDSYVGNPTIIMISDLVSAQHSMISPLNHAVQIVGRFRRPKEGEIQREIIHISNYEPLLTSMNKEEVLAYLKECHVVYRVLKRFLKASTEKGAVQTLREILKRIEYAKFINQDGSKNYFMQDNMIYEEQLKGFYQSNTNLKSAYELSGHFKLTEIVEDYDLTDKDLAKASSIAPLKTIYEVLLPILQEINGPHYNLFQRYTVMNHLQKEYPKVIAIFNQIGYEKALELKFDHRKIIAAIKSNKRRSSLFGLIEFIEENFSEGIEYSSLSIYEKTKAGITINNLTQLKPGVKLLSNFCDLSDRITLGRTRIGKEIKGYRVLKIHNKRQMD